MSCFSSSVVDMDSTRPIKGHAWVRVAEGLMRRFPRLGARLYGLQDGFPLGGMYCRVAREIVGLMGSGAVLDVGTGPVCLPLELALLSPDLAVTGVDLSPAMIQLARRKACRCGVESRVTFLTGDAAGLPVQDASFDMVVTTLSLHHWYYQRKVMSELYRTMKLGGGTWVYDIFSPGIQQALEEIIGSSSFREYGMSWVRYSRWWPGGGLLKIEPR